MIRGLGYLRSLEDIRQIALGVGNDGIPILLRDVATVAVGLRCAGDWPSGTEREKPWGHCGRSTWCGCLPGDPGMSRRSLNGLKPGLPEGVRIEVAYDRSALIERAVFSLEKSLAQLLVIVGWSVWSSGHVRSGLGGRHDLAGGKPDGLIVLHLQGLSVNIMSLGASP